MICNRRDQGWELIYQQAHALVAATIVAHWRPSEHCIYWQESLVAIAQHDNGWQEWESGRRLTDAGEPLDFMDTPIEDVVAQGARAVTRAWHQSLWIGLLVSLHISHLHESRRGEYEPLDELLDAQKQLQAQWRDVLGVSEHDTRDAYAFLRWSDTLSLILCRHKLSENNRRVAIGKGPGGGDYEAIVAECGSFSVRPWPFSRDALEVQVDAYGLDCQWFSDTDALANAIYQAKPHVLRWRLVRES